jgi:hypothetical protein
MMKIIGAVLFSIPFVFIGVVAYGVAGAVGVVSVFGLAALISGCLLGGCHLLTR